MAELFRGHDASEYSWRNWSELLSGWPGMSAKFTTHADFARTPFSQILGEQASSIHRLSAGTLATTLWLNRGDHFEKAVLPAAAQWAPVFGLSVADFDGDGAEDVFMAQNFCAVRPEDTRMDAGRGLLLRGDGRGGFVAVPGQLDGIKIYGEQRGCAVGDFDGDGRVDLVVSQNTGETKLYMNRIARTGLRVRLAGPPDNPEGLGAVVRLKFGERSGPARRVNAGGGYWSQDSPVLVMAAPAVPTSLEIRWPGGKMTSTLLPAALREIRIGPEGLLKP